MDAIIDLLLVLSMIMFSVSVMAFVIYAWEAIANAIKRRKQ